MSDNIKIDIQNLTCGYCDKTFISLHNLRRHCGTIYHTKNVTESGIPHDVNEIVKGHRYNVAEINRQERNKKVTYFYDYDLSGKKLCHVPLNNGSFIIVNKHIWKVISQYTIIGDTLKGYPSIQVGDETYYLHRYIYYNIFNRAPQLGHDIDHDNRKTLDVRIENLREVLPEINNRNRTKSKNATSIYKGVHYDKRVNKWKCQLKTDNHHYHFQYDNELHAAYHYNLLVIVNNLQSCTPLNIIDKPEDFIASVHYVKPNDLPKGIEVKGKKYRYKYKGKYSRCFITMEEALEERNLKLEQGKIDEINKILTEPIKRNNDGVPIIEIVNKQGRNVEIKIDAHRYYEAKLNSVYYGTNLATIAIDGNHSILSRYLLNCNDKTKYVDHKDSDNLNYQMNNLRIVSKLQNAQNKSSEESSSSKYVGVSFNQRNNTWAMAIRCDKISYRKIFKTEYECAIARDMKAYELNLLGNMFKINLPEELQVNLFIKSLDEEHFNFDYLFYSN